MKKVKIVYILFFCFLISNAQEIIHKPDFLKYNIDADKKERILNALDSLFKQLAHNNLDKKYIAKKQAGLTISTLQMFQSYENSKDSTSLKVKDKQLINFYPVTKSKYALSIAYISYENTLPKILYLLNLIAKDDNGEISFSIPIDYLTRYWKTEVIDNITYHYRDTINKKRPIIFNKKNTQIANKLGVKPEKLDFYMCDNYQEIVQLLGLDYWHKANGKYRDGYGVDNATIFSIMNNEDFSHDMFHYYSGKVNKKENRNWISEEGLAYSWGNAYYTDVNGEMITHKKLVKTLKAYLNNNPNANLFELFKSNTKIFNQLAPEISVRSTISGIIANEIEREYGKEGIMKFINCGRKDSLNNFLKMIKDFLGINGDNFNFEIKRMLNKNY